MTLRHIPNAINDFSQAYINYAFDPTVENTYKLVHEIQNYNFDEYQNTIRILSIVHQNIHINYDKDIRLSNGTCENRKREYFFGPNVHLLDGLLSNFVRFPYGKPKKYKNALFMSVPFDEDVFEIHNKEIDIYPFVKSDKYHHDYVICTNMHLPSSKNKILKSLDIIEENLLLSGRPDQIIFLLTDKNITAKMKEKFWQINSTWSDAFFPCQDIYVNDNMLSWKSGICFYTCKKKQKHFLPIFYKINNRIYNLLNFTNPKVYDDTDLITFEKVETCFCGKKRACYDFVSHYKNAIKDRSNKYVKNDFANELNGYYSFLQFLKKDEHLNICVSNISELYKDLEKILSHFDCKSHEIHIDKGFKIGTNKWPILWNDFDSVKLKNLIY